MVINGLQQQNISASQGQSDISVIICAYTELRWDDMIAAVEALQCQTLAPLEIILVIDHNPGLLDRTRIYLAHSGIKVIENEGQRGLSSARNSGMSVATGGTIAFMDEDAIAAPDWLSQLNSSYQNSEIMGVGGAIQPVWLNRRPKWFPEEFDWVVGCTYRGMPLTESPVRNLIGCNMSFRRDICELNGTFRDGIGRVGALPVGCEETEYCIRAHQRWPQKQLIYNPQAQVYHKVSPLRSTWKYFCSRCYAEGISKALIGRYVGTSSSLASEKTYVLKTLPKGVLRSLETALLHVDVNGFLKAGAIIIGLSLTTFGYIATKLLSNRNQMLEVLDNPQRI